MEIDLDAWRRLIAPLQRRVMLMVARSVIKATTDSEKIQQAQLEVLSDEVRDKVPRVQEYGFSSRPKQGAECVVLFLGGNRDNGVIIATDDGRYRFKELKEGEVALYTDEGDSIYFKRGKVIKITAQSKLEIESPEVTISGKLTVSGEVKGNGKALSTHTHSSGALAAPNGPVSGATGAPQ